MDSLEYACEQAANYRMVDATPVPPPVKIEPADIPKKKSCVVMIQVSKELKTNEERAKEKKEQQQKAEFEKRGKEALNRLAGKFATRGKEEPQNESRTVYSWERPYHQPGFRD